MGAACADEMGRDEMRSDQIRSEHFIADAPTHARYKKGLFGEGENAFVFEFTWLSFFCRAVTFLSLAKGL